MRAAVPCVAVIAVTLAGAAQAQIPAPFAPTVKMGGYVQARETYQENIGLTAFINRARVTLDGNLGDGFTFRIMGGYEPPTALSGVSLLALRDAYVRWKRAPVTVTAGQYKTPFSREYLMSITIVETVDRALVVDGLSPKRDIGLMAEGEAGSYATLSAGVFNGEGQNSLQNRDSTVMVVTRLVLRPIAAIQLAGNVASYSSDSTRYGVEAGFDVRGFSVRSEYIGQSRHNRSPDDSGWYVLATYRVLPWVQLVARQEDFRQLSINKTRLSDGTTGGVNVDFAGGRVRLAVDGIFRTTGNPKVHQNRMVAQLQAKI